MTITMSAREIHWTCVAKTTGFAVTQTVRTSNGSYKKGLSTHRTEGAAAKQLTSAAKHGVGNLNIAKLTK